MIQPESQCSGKEEEFHVLVEDEKDYNYAEHEGMNEEGNDNVMNEKMVERMNEKMQDDYEADEGSQLCPCVGMEFDSDDEAYEFYNKYAKRMGFSTRKLDCRKSQRNGEIIGRCFSCSLEGYTNAKSTRVEVGKKRRQESRTGCKAMMRIIRKKERWVVSRVVEMHNHILTTPSKRHKLPSQRKISEGHGAMLENMRAVGLRTNLMMNFMTLEAGGSCNPGFTTRDARNFLTTKRQKELKKGDAVAVLDYLQCHQANNPSFFHSIQVDSEGHMTNIFWADARSRMDYHYFGDVVGFDPTYGTTKYHKPFVPIVGVNHHNQTMIFGGALLFDETEESFVWVMKTWMKAMGGRQPKVILTDQESAIGGAIARVLPGTKHRFCLWHIMRNAMQNIPYIFNAHNGFRNDFNNCLYNGETIEEFEQNWESMLERYNLRDNGWLVRLYGKREKWASVYTRDVFCANMYTTQRSESINAYFDGYLRKAMPLYEFVRQFDRAVIKRREAENDEDFENNYRRPILQVGMYIEKDAAQIYTRTILEKFQGELLQSLNYCHEKNGENEFGSSYSVWIRDNRQSACTVTYDHSNNDAKCSCRLFEFAGYLCRHILKIFACNDVQKLPPQYVLKRWTRDAKSGSVIDDIGEEIKADCHEYVTLRYSNLCCEATNIASKAAVDKGVYKVAMNGLHKLLNEVEVALKKIPNDPQLKNKEVESTCINDNNCGSPRNQLGCQRHLLDPVIVKHKGRPKKHKSFLDKLSKKKVTTKTDVVGEKSGVRRQRMKARQIIEPTTVITNDHLGSSSGPNYVGFNRQPKNLISPHIFTDGSNHSYVSDASFLEVSSQACSTVEHRAPPEVAWSDIFSQNHAPFIVGHQYQENIPTFSLSLNQLEDISKIDLNGPNQHIYR